LGKLPVVLKALIQATSFSFLGINNTLVPDQKAGARYRKYLSPGDKS
jgi:hypothetical protein